MINRRNWKLSKKYLEYRESVDLLSEGSMRLESTYVRHILEWAGAQSFRDASSIRPTLPEYLLTARMDGGVRPLSSGYIRKALSTARRLFTWMGESQSDYQSISGSWIRTLKSRRISDPLKSQDIVTYEEILQIAHAPVGNLMENRIRAAAVFWYLSGIRISAFVSLPIRAVEINERTIKQFPDMGVRTKNKKFAITHLLPLPQLLKIVTDWDAIVRSVLPPSGFWFAPISPLTGDINPSCTEVGIHRHNLARRNLKAWLDKVGLKYHAPHKFRHGHIHYGIKHSMDIADFKAVSMNVMHSSMKITDEIYSKLSDDDIQARIDNLGNGRNGSLKGDGEVFDLFQEFLEWRQLRGEK